jgi:hypothetical protein
MFWESGWGGHVPFKVPLNAVSIAKVICNYRPLLIPITLKAMLFRAIAIYLHEK